MASGTPGVISYGDEKDQSDSEYTPLYDNDEIDERTAQETKGWNLFREIPVKKESGSMASTACVDITVKALKLVAYVVVFCAVLGAAVVAKGALLFITSQLKKDRPISHCNRPLALDRQFVAVLSLEDRVAWLWAALIVFGIPEIGIFLRSLRICFFRTAKKPTKGQFLLAFIIETLHVIGLAMLLLIILPELDVVKGAMLMNAVCIVPGVLNAITRDRYDQRYVVKILLDVVAVSAQATAFVVWPLLNEQSPILWAIPVACMFISIGWWENFVNSYKHSPFFVAFLCKLRDQLKTTRYFTSLYLSIWRILVFTACIMISLHIQGDDPFAFFTSIHEAFSDRIYTAREIQVVLEDAYNNVIEYEVSGTTFPLPVTWTSPLWVALIRVAAAWVCFGAGKFACKILIQSFSFSFALNLVGPVTINLLILFCGLRNADTCYFHYVIPDYLFFNIPPVHFLKDYIGGEMTWVWLLWLASQSWITVHTWQPKCERLAASEKLFAKPWYCGSLIDQSLLLNRTKDDDVDIHIEVPI